MFSQAKKFTVTQVAHAAFCMKTIALVIMMLHGQCTQQAQGFMIPGRTWWQYQIIVEAGGNRIAMQTLPALASEVCIHERPRTRMLRVPAMAGHSAWQQLAH